MLDQKKHEVRVDGLPVTLTLKEVELLELLIRNKNIVLSRDRLLEEVWGYVFDGETRTIDVHIRTLRRNLMLDQKKHEVRVDGLPVTLTLKEVELLELLIRNKNIVLSRDRLLEEVWGYVFDGETRTIDVHIRTLRQKLKSAGDLIETVRGVGYRMGGQDET